MAAAAVTELLGGTPRACIHAAAMALMNTIGLVCDPVGGYVEVPCVSVIPPDEVVLAMASVGRLLPPELRETGEGGIADTPTGRRIALEMAR